MLEEEKYFEGDFSSLSRKFNFHDFERYLNSFQIGQSNIDFKQVAGLIPIPGKTIARIAPNTTVRIEPIGLINPKLNPSFEQLLSYTKRYVQSFSEDEIAVELSGGLDTSLIIELLKICNIKPILIGIVSDKYEFRTERFIQNYYLSQNNKTILFNQIDIKPFSNLLEIPLHPYPDAAALYFNKSKILYDTAKRKGAKIVLHGGTGDNFLCCDVSLNELNVNKIRALDRYSLSDEWVNNNICSQIGIKLVSAFSLNLISRTILGMRNGQSSDPFKLWARSSFREIIPETLSKFAYKASHDGWISTGLSSAKAEISFMANEVNRVLNFDNIDVNKLTRDLDGYIFLSEQQQTKILATLSYLAWIYGFIRDGIVNASKT